MLFQVENCAKPVDGDDRWDLEDCPQCSTGVLNSQGCQGAPAFGSSPHFFNADPSLALAVDGLNPSHENHSTFLNIEPYSGVSFLVHKRIQVSIKFHHVTKAVTMQESVKRTNK